LEFRSRPFVGQRAHKMALLRVAFLAAVGGAQSCKDILGWPQVPRDSLSAAEQNCWQNLLWAKDVGIYTQSLWYKPHGLTPKCSFADFQYFLYNKSGNGIGPSYDCVLPCSSHFTQMATSSTSPTSITTLPELPTVPPPEDGLLGTGSAAMLGNNVDCKDVVGPPFTPRARLTAVEENCWVNLLWALSDDMTSSWYAEHALSPKSPLTDLQLALHESSEKCVGPHRLCPCPLPCMTASSTTAPSTTRAELLTLGSPCKDVVGPPLTVGTSLTPQENNCWFHLLWAKNTGIYTRSEWYVPHGLTSLSPYADYQYFLHNKSGNGVGPTYDCSLPCTSKLATTAHMESKGGSQAGPKDAKAQPLSSDRVSSQVSDNIACKDILGPPLAPDASLTPQENNCWTHLVWAKNTGIYTRSEWYIPYGLTSLSPYADYQYFLYNMSGNAVGPTFDCPLPCNSKFSKTIYQEWNVPRAEATKVSAGQTSSASDHVPGHSSDDTTCKDIIGPPDSPDAVLTPLEANCWVTLRWISSAEMTLEWYQEHSLSPHSPLADFQELLHRSGLQNCTLPCRHPEVAASEASTSGAVVPRMPWTWTVVFLGSVGVLIALLYLFIASTRRLAKASPANISPVDAEQADAAEDLMAEPEPVSAFRETWPAFQHIPVPQRGMGHLSAQASPFDHGAMPVWQASGGRPSWSPLMPPAGR